MQCPNCKIEMEKGQLSGRGVVGDFKWSPEKAFGNAFYLGGTKLVAYKCPQCGKVELTTEVKS